MPKMTPAAAATNAGDHGRKPHELPWLYLDSVGQEYGPIPGWTMREWLQLGRFPVGRDLRVRLPEWEHHLPLHQLYGDLSTVFVLPPAWPDVYSDGVLQCEDEEDRPTASSAQQSKATSSALPPDAVPLGQGLPEPPAAPPNVASAAKQGHAAMAAAHNAAVAKAQAIAAGVSAGTYMGVDGSRESAQRPPSGWPSRLVNQPLNPREDPGSRPGSNAHAEVQGPGRTESPPPKPQFVLERLMQEEQLLPPPPPQPSELQLRELLSQPQEGPPLWEDGQAEPPAGEDREAARPPDGGAGGGGYASNPSNGSRWSTPPPQLQ